LVSLHPQIQAYVDGLAALDGKALWQMTPQEARDRQAQVREALSDGPAMATVEVGPGRLYVPAPDTCGLVVFLHGGGWVTGTLELVDPMCRRLAAVAGARVLSVDYRLAPEHPYPAAVDDAWDAVTWAAQRAGGEPLVVIGESAGGNLAAVCARRAVERGGPAIDLQVLVNPVCDGDPTTGSYAEFGEGASPVGARELAWFWDQYAPPERRGEPDASPLRAPDLRGQAPALILQPEVDPLRDEVLAYAARLEAAGIPVRLERFADCIHGFFFMVGAFTRADEAVDLVGDAIRSLPRPPGA
jgi:acetyl esterase